MTDEETPDWKLRLDARQAREHLEWAKGEMMKAGATIMKVLKEVHDKRSYRFDFASFEEYCAKEWNFGVRRAHQLVNGENFRALMADAGGAEDVKDLGEGPLRELSKVAPEEAVVVLRAVAKTGKPTAKRLRAVIRPEREVGAVVKKCPHCGGVL